MARSTMAALLTRLRLLVNDTAGASQTFSDDDLQRALDGQRFDARYSPLAPIDSIAAGGVISWFSWEADRGDWEDTATFADGSYNALTVSASDLIRGIWTFATHQANSVLLSGSAYNLYAAAADVLEILASRKASEFDFTADGASFSRSQAVKQLRDQASAYRDRAGAWGKDSTAGAGAYAVEVYV
jgi:hypothetical protein